MLGWFIVLVPTVIIVIDAILSTILRSNKTKYNAEHGKFREEEIAGTLGKRHRLHKILRFLYYYESRFFATTIISMVCMVVIVLAIFCNQMKTRSFIAKYENVATEYEIRSDTFSALERAAAFNYAIDLTAEASVYRYWDKYFDPFIPDEVNNLKPIR